MFNVRHSIISLSIAVAVANANLTHADLLNAP